MAADPRAGSYRPGDEGMPDAAWRSRGAWRRSRRHSWMLNGWTTSMTLGAQGGGTEFMTIGVPDDFFAVRVGLANVNTAPWRVKKIIACASSSWSDYFTPLEGARTQRPPNAWSVLTFQNRGADESALVTATGAPAGITVAGNAADPASGETSNANWTFTDWVPCASVGPDPATGMRVLMLRALIPGNQTVSFTNGTMNGGCDVPSLNNGHGYFVGGLKHDIDMVSDPAHAPVQRLHAGLLEVNRIVNGQTMCLIQVMTRNPGIVGMAAGDSHQAGTSTTAQINNFVLQCLHGICDDTIGSMPVGVVNTCVGGAVSQQFFPRMTALLNAVRPTFVVMPCWSYNELEGGRHATAAAGNVVFARMAMAADQVRAAGAVPIFLTPFPRGVASMPASILATWLAHRDAILSERDGDELVLDATPLLAETVNGQYTGAYIDGLSVDSIHPGDEGHAVLARALTPIVRAIAGLPAHSIHQSRQPAAPPGGGLIGRILGRWQQREV